MSAKSMEKHTLTFNLTSLLVLSKVMKSSKTEVRKTWLKSIHREHVEKQDQEETKNTFLSIKRNKWSNSIWIGVS